MRRGPAAAVLAFPSEVREVLRMLDRTQGTNAGAPATPAR